MSMGGWYKLSWDCSPQVDLSLACVKGQIFEFFSGGAYVCQVPLAVVQLFLPELLKYIPNYALGNSRQVLLFPTHKRSTVISLGRLLNKGMFSSDLDSCNEVLSLIYDMSGSSPKITLNPVVVDNWDEAKVSNVLPSKVSVVGSCHAQDVQREVEIESLIKSSPNTSPETRKSPVKEKFKLKNLLSNHLKRSTNVEKKKSKTKRMYKCCVCSKGGFPNRSAFFNHLAASHHYGKKAEDYFRGEKKEGFECLLCDDKVVSTQPGIVSHIGRRHPRELFGPNYLDKFEEVSAEDVSDIDDEDNGGSKKKKHEV